MSTRAMLQPSVPAPSSRKRVSLNRPGSRSGSSRHFISFTLRSTASAAMRRLSRKAFRSTELILDHPAKRAVAGGGETSTGSTNARFASTTNKRERTGASALRLFKCKSRKARKRRVPGRWCATTSSRLRRGHPKAPSEVDGSTKPTMRSSSAPDVAPSAAGPSRAFVAGNADNGCTSQGAPEDARTRTNMPADASLVSSRRWRATSHNCSRPNPSVGCSALHGVSRSDHGTEGARTGKASVYEKRYVFRSANATARRGRRRTGSSSAAPPTMSSRNASDAAATRWERASLLMYVLNSSAVLKFSSSPCTHAAPGGRPVGGSSYDSRPKKHFSEATEAGAASRGAAAS
mmetsp:Transcript_73356/g.203604  ORF Transcript_73356/g.203604 Transcript_73356/m.203604 type:complete len:348 (-) Transcript_73356:269-1312(-)